MCTWVDCKEEGTHVQLDKFGKEWAKLCSTHHILLDNALKNLEARKILSYWVKASGGSRKLTDKMQPEIESCSKLLFKLCKWKPKDWKTKI
jgi:hypothetical protein